MQTLREGRDDINLGPSFSCALCALDVQLSTESISKAPAEPRRVFRKLQLVRSVEHHEQDEEQFFIDPAMLRKSPEGILL